MAPDDPLSPRNRREIERYLQTGETVELLDGSTGDHFSRARETSGLYRDALIAEVRRRAAGARTPRHFPSEAEVTALASSKLRPMVHGLFPPAEREIVLATLQHSIVFLSEGSIERVLTKMPWPSTAWTLACIYLASVGADPLADDVPNAVGLSQETTCYVSLEYFDGSGRFDDFVVHEAAHVFHNSKRVTLGLPERRGCEWLLDIDFHKRETFAYACETYSRIVELASLICWCAPVGRRAP